MLVYNAIESGIVALICFGAGFFVSILLRDGQTQLDSLWCMLSGLVVLQWLAKNAISIAKETIIGSMIGCVISAIVCYLIGYHYTSIFLSVSISILVTGFVKYQRGIVTASVTAAGMAGFGMLNSDVIPQINSLMRAADTIIGVALAVLVIIVSSWLKIRKDDQLV